jgi:lipoate-protein ligase A
MAVDEAILESVEQGVSPATLRLYAWEPPCLSLGYTQKFAEADVERLLALGWDLVRRPTGGRAILHTDELTYAVIGLESDPRLSGSVLESYRRLSAALLAALHALGLPAEALERSKRAENPGPKGPVCFEVPSNYEITVGGKKLIGSAQARRRAAVLQHGSLPLTGDLRRIVQALAFPTEEQRREAAERLSARATTCALVLGEPVSWEMAAQAFQAAFESTLSLELAPGELTASELARAAALAETKYGHESWTERL